MLLNAIDDAWKNAVASGDFQLWTEHLDRIEVGDHFGFLEVNRASLLNSELLPLHKWVNCLGGLTQSELYNILNETSRSVYERLAVATFVRWVDRTRDLLIRCESLPGAGVLQYFSDGLQLCVLLGYRKVGTTIALEELLAFPAPEALFDPVQALSWATTDPEVELLRRALSTRHKIVVHRNVLTYLDREFEAQVFGPSIDTLMLNEWLFEHRYMPQRSLENMRYFEEIMPSDLARETALAGTRFLEVGCGNGLLTATFAKNEAKISQICAIDVLMPAVFATYRNSWNQRRLPQAGMIGDRARYVTARYSKDAVPNNNDIIVCNPPYIPNQPMPTAPKNLHPLRAATLGTELLETVVNDAPALLSESGQLLVVASELSAQELERAIPTGFTFKRAKTMAVPFNVGAARREAGLLEWLQKTRGLIKSDNGYRHDVTIFVIERISPT